jgi:hypothetical protein
MWLQTATRTSQTLPDVALVESVALTLEQRVIATVFVDGTWHVLLGETPPEDRQRVIEVADAYLLHSEDRKEQRRPPIAVSTFVQMSGRDVDTHDVTRELFAREQVGPALSVLSAGGAPGWVSVPTQPPEVQQEGPSATFLEMGLERGV